MIEVSVVVPVYRGADTIESVVTELADLVEPAATPEGLPFRVSEVVLAWDNGPDGSDAAIHALADRYDFVRPVWLSRNFGQHAATVAGVAATVGTWVITMDEDGQHDPADIGRMLDVAYRERAALVYAAATNPAPHGRLRNGASRLTKGLVLRLLRGRSSVAFSSFRLVFGEHARAVAAYCGPGVYLDVALTWVIGAIATCPVRSRAERREVGGYSTRKLVSHFWRLVLSSGNRLLRLVSGVGVLVAVAGLAYAVVLVVQRSVGEIEVPGWTSAMVAVLILGGINLIALGVIAEYVGMAAGMSMGKPLFVVVSDAFPLAVGRREGPVRTSG